MPIISTVERKSLKGRLIFAVVYTFLVLGGITMIYPFMIMFTGAVSSTADHELFSPFPMYVVNQEALYRKIINDRYNAGYRGSIDQIRQQHKFEFTTAYLYLQEVHKPDVTPEHAKNMIDDWHEFMPTVPGRYWQTAATKRGHETGRTQYRFQEYIAQTYGTDIQTLREIVPAVEHLGFIYSPIEEPLNYGWVPDVSRLSQVWDEFKQKNLTIDDHYLPSCNGQWREFLKSEYKKSVDQTTLDKINEAFATSHKSLNDINLPRSFKHATELGIASLWSDFVIKKLAPRYMLLDPSLEPIWQQWIEKQYRTIGALNSVRNTSFKSLADVHVPQNLEEEDDIIVIQDVRSILELPGVVEKVTLVAPVNRYHDFLKSKYAGIDDLSIAYGTEYTDFQQAVIPHAVIDWDYAQRTGGEWRKYFLTSNFTVVIDYIFSHGRALLNTFIYCSALILTTLTVNPLCAFALSRFKLPYANKVLIFLLATMAFPAEVAIIPNFLLLRSFDLLNSYWALILPGMANGYSIFLLKGFFDSLPDELYEAAEIDGAGEMRIFFQITLPMAKPVMAYLGLGAFTMAYQAFMFAMIVCPDQQWWTIMVFLYDMGNWASPSQQMAGFVLASIPTLVVFVFAQRVIMRGIVIPMDK